jgi:hypothetical protein
MTGSCWSSASDAFLTVRPAERRFDGADEAVADPLRQRMRVADSLGVHHHDEVDTRRFPGLLGDRLEHAGGIG